MTRYRSTVIPVLRPACASPAKTWCSDGASAPRALALLPAHRRSARHVEVIRHAEANDLVGRNVAEPIEQPRLESSCRASVRYSGSGVSDSRPVIATGAQVFGTNLKA